MISHVTRPMSLRLTHQKSDLELNNSRRRFEIQRALALAASLRTLYIHLELTKLNFY